MDMEFGRKNTEPSIVIFTLPGSFQEGLKALLVAIHPSIDIWIAESEEVGKWLVKNTHPRLVMIDSAAFQDAGVEFSQHLKAKNNNVKFLVFIETVRDSRVFEKIGIDGLLYKGFTNQELEHMIETLLIDSVEAPP